MRFISIILLAVFASACGKRDAATTPTTTIPPGVAKAFTENTESVQRLRRWIADPLPADTTILSYHTETVWDGSAFERWLFHSPSGFAALTQTTKQRDALQIPSGAPYKIVERPLRALGVELAGKRPRVVWALDWKTQTNNTSVRGLILPHGSGEILEVERITVK